jgi:DNA-binding MarR family transcriptional regulator
MAVLYASDEADFLFLTNATGLTKGNLSAHVAKLEEVGYVTVTKSYNGKIPHTAYALTRRGRAAFARYHKDLSEITRRVGKARPKTRTPHLPLQGNAIAPRRWRIRFASSGNQHPSRQ